MPKQIKPKAQDLLVEFADYIENHPEERFWQALKNWSGAESIWSFSTCSEGCSDHGEDTYNWKNKNC